MKKVLWIAFAITLILGSGTAVYAVPGAPDIDVPDVTGVPEVGSAAPSAPGVTTGRGVVTSKRTPRAPWQSSAVSSTSAAGIPAVVFGAGVSGKFTDESASSPYLSLYADWYPLVIDGTFGIGSTLTADIVPIENGDVVVGIQADARLQLPLEQGIAAWADVRVGPSYETTSHNLSLYGYADLGINLDLDGMFLDMRLGAFLTGTAVGVVFGVGMSL
jgi:hypothetical protein